jgi:predicted aspartyl protease
MPRLQDRIDFDGAIITVQIELSALDEAFLRTTGLPVPPPFPTTALIDTGASHTVVHPMVLDHLSPVEQGFARVAVPGQPDSRLSFYDVRVSLGPYRPAFEVQVVKVVPATPTVAVLIGRDILKQGALLFDGQNETLSFWF